MDFEKVHLRDLRFWLGHFSIPNWELSDRGMSHEAAFLGNPFETLLPDSSGFL